MSNQLVSIITICYNAENDIRKTIESVVKQSYNDYQFIIKRLEVVYKCR